MRQGHGAPEPRVLRLVAVVSQREEPALLDQWMANWSDITDFEVYPVLTSKEAAEKIAPLL